MRKIGTISSSGYRINASGGIITTFQDYKYHTFLSSGTFDIIGFSSSSQLIECLVIGGGGAGGNGVSGGYAGGGGAGRVINATFNPSINSFNVGLFCFQY